MRLDNDCIRDILLFIEDNTTYEKRFIDVDNLVNYLNYDKDTLYYHLSMISQANLVDKVNFADNRPYLISSLSWEGHQYLDNIRNDGVWKTVKEKSSALGSVSLQVLIPLAEAVIKQKLGLS